ncbi:hypothetical protein LTS18_003774 [Coniosporium uncinatum]|uniref:Uncharacterized protein n=1 Tax=Coniosporium uncinatum TaxID=93489 RepID=A0ACC3DT18_9PEZI|nr:hypothetical protein LTS18_003774 [Coniosporium uncinatum]
MASPGKPTLHHLNNSQSQRILWLLEELRLAYPTFSYDLKHYHRSTSGANRGRAPPELKDVSPLGKSPCLVTASGRTLTESNTIASYLIRTYDTEWRFLGDERKGLDWIRDDTLCNFAAATMGPTLTMYLILSLLTGATPWVLRALPGMFTWPIIRFLVRPEMEAQLKYLEEAVGEGENEFFMGTERPGRADFMLSFPFDLMVAQGWEDLGQYPRLRAWRERYQAREGWKRGLSEGNGYDMSKF